MLTWVHFGDLHASDEDEWESLGHLQTLVGDVNDHLEWFTDFAFLPGDNANHGADDQYARISAILDRLNLRWFAIPGDHDFEPRSLAHFYQGLGAVPLPHRAMLKGHRCLFLDIVSPGGGGPDFRLGEHQRAWLQTELEQSRIDAERPVVFMHAFPGDLAEDGDRVAALFAEYGVACVDTGHTHYNELLNDGAVIYTATRSTGQIEEGPVGFSLHAVDGAVTSWRFKPLAQPWPFVLITSPADHRLVTDPGQPGHVSQGAFTVRAKVFGNDVTRVLLTVEDAPPVAMTKAPGGAGRWTGEVRPPVQGRLAITVTAITADGARDSDTIVTQVGTSGAAPTKKAGAKLGHHFHSIGAWPEHGLLGTQLEPNKNGRKW